jgi:hypothetical protein
VKEPDEEQLAEIEKYTAKEQSKAMKALEEENEKILWEQFKETITLKQNILKPITLKF